MTKKTIRSGKTRTAPAFIPEAADIDIQGGQPGTAAGGTLLATGVVSNAGRIRVLSSSQPVAGGAYRGGVLDVSGVLTNLGDITVYGGHTPYRGKGPVAPAVLNITGRLTDQGTLSTGVGANAVTNRFYQIGGQITVATSGVLTVTGASNTTAAGTLDNDGLLVNAGTVTVQGGGYQGDFNRVFRGADLSGFGGIQNSGTLIVGGGFANGASYAPSSLGGVVATGPLNNTGLIVLDHGGAGPLQSGGYFVADYPSTNSGTIDVQGGPLGSGGFPDLHTASGLLRSDDLTNVGLLRLEGGVAGDFYTQGGSGGYVTDDLYLGNIGTIDIQGGTSGGYYGGSHGGTLSVRGSYGGATLTNIGLISVDAGGDPRGGAYKDGGDGGMLINAGVFTNGGRLLALGGLAAGGGYNGATRGGTVTNTGVLTNQGAITVAGGAAGHAYFGEPTGGGYGGYLISSGTLTNTGHILVAAGTFGAQGYNGYGGSLADTGMLSNIGTIEVRGAGDQASRYRGLYAFGAVSVAGALSNSGVIMLGGGDGATARYTGTARYPDLGALLTVAGTLVNTGTISLGAGTGSGTERIGAELAIGGTLVDSGVITLAAQPGGQSAATLLVDAGATVSLAGATISGGGLIANGGFIEGYGSVTGPAFANDGTVLATGGLLTIDGAISGTGTFEIGAGGTLDLNGTLSHGARVGFASTEATLMGTLADLNGDTIGNFAGADVIDIADLLPGSGLVLAYTAGVGQGVLTLSEGARSATLALGGSFTQPQFTTASDGHGGLLIGLH